MRIFAAGTLTGLITGCAITISLAPTAAVAQSHLPPCPSDPNVVWTYCEGTRSYYFEGPSQYVGEFRDNKRNGQGTQTLTGTLTGHFEFHDVFSSGSIVGTKYVGEWRDDQKNGQGTETWPDGRKYVGEFKDGLKNGQGT
jgi:hypothetical protein